MNNASLSVEFIESTLQLKLLILQKIKDTFAILTKRSIVERHSSGLVNLAKEFEIVTNSTEKWVAYCYSHNRTFSVVIKFNQTTSQK